MSSRLRSIHLLMIPLLAAACQLRSLSSEPSEITLTPAGTALPSASAAVSAEPLEVGEGDSNGDLGILAAAPPTDIAPIPQGRNNPTLVPPANRCVAVPSGNFDVNIREYPGAQYTLAGRLYNGQYSEAYGRTADGWYQVDIPGTGYGYVSSSVVTLSGPCSLQIVSEPRPPTSVGNSVASLPGATPTSHFLSLYISGYAYVTTRQVGSIATNTQVSINTGMFDGNSWSYTIMTRDGKTGEARDADLTYAPGITPGAPTPAPAFTGGWGYSFITTQQVGSIAPNTRVAISTYTYDGYEWIYTITTDRQTYVDARQSQLAAAPGTNPVGPTPTAGLNLALGAENLWYLTTAQVGSIRPNTRVSVGGAYFDGYGWMYMIATADGQQSGEARESQLTLAPDAPAELRTPSYQYVSPTPVPTMAACRAQASNAPFPVVNIRSGPGANFPALNAFGGSDNVPVLGRSDNGWYLVRMDVSGNIFEGFAPPGEILLVGDCNNLTSIAASYQETPAVQGLPPGTSPDEVVIPDGACAVIAISASANIYSANSTDTTVIGILQPGPWLTANARDGKGWYRVTLFSGGLGWLDGSQVQVNGLGGACDALPVL